MIRIILAAVAPGPNCAGCGPALSNKARRPVKMLKSAAQGLLIVLPLVACGGGGSESEKAPTPETEKLGFVDENAPAAVDLVSHMVLDRFVSATAKESLVRDFKRIERFDLTTKTANDASLKNLLDVQDLSGATLSSWLKQRVRYLLSPDLAQYRVGTLSTASKSLAVSRLPGLDPEETQNVAAAMVGTRLYEIGKSLRTEDPSVDYLMIEINDSWVHLNTQRNGVMQIGPALFDPRFMPNTVNPAAYANTAVRVETLFHEARHADGNQVSGSFGFYHAVCPEGSGVAKEFRGQRACDDNANGPYTLGAQIVKAYLANCGEFCSPQDRSVLQAFMLDSLSRVVQRPNGSLPKLDVTPEKGFEKVDISNFSLIPARSMGL